MTAIRGDQAPAALTDALWTRYDRPGPGRPCATPRPLPRPGTPRRPGSGVAHAGGGAGRAGERGNHRTRTCARQLRSLPRAGLQHLRRAPDQRRDTRRPPKPRLDTPLGAREKPQARCRHERVAGRAGPRTRASRSGGGAPDRSRDLLAMARGGGWRSDGVVRRRRDAGPPKHAGPRGDDRRS